MLKTIVRQSPQLVSFLVALQLALSKPQMRRVTQMTDALLTCERRKTLSDLYRQYLMELDPKAAADCFREGPWRPEDIRGPRCKYLLAQMLEFGRLLDYPPIIWVSVDDSLGKKDKATRHQDAVDLPVVQVQNAKIGKGPEHYHRLVHCDADTIRHGHFCYAIRILRCGDI